MNRLSRLLATATALGLAALPARAIEDSPPVDVRSTLEAIRAIGSKQSDQTKALRNKAIQDATAAAGSPSRAVELWEEAIRATQFFGVSKENAQWREWKDKEGDALKEKEVQSALRLYFNWLALTLRHGDGNTTVKDLMPAVMAHVRDAIADEAMMDNFDETVKKEREKESAPNAKGKANPRDREKKGTEAQVKKLHDEIAKRPLGTSVYAEWMHIADLIQQVAPAAQRQRGGQGQQANKPGMRKREEPESPWEGTPANVDGIYQNISLPYLREQKDPHVVDYWDYLLRHEGDVATRTKLQFEIDKFNQQRRPQLLWGRAEELVTLGLKNRAATEMLGLIKANPTHPDLQSWITELEGILVPPVPQAPSISTTPAGGAPAPQ